MIRKTLRKVLSLTLVMAMLLTTFCCFDIGTLKSKAWLNVAEVESTGRPEITFYAPEAIYLKYNSKDIQFWVDNDQNGAVIRKPDSTTATITFTSSVPCSSITITASGAATTANITSTGYTGSGSAFTATLSSGTLSSYSSSSNCYIEWKCTYVAGGTTFETYAYTYVYSPYGGIIGGCYSGCSTAFDTGYYTLFNMTAGFHSIPATSLRGYTNGTYETILTGTGDTNRSPLITPVGTNQHSTGLGYVPMTDKHYEGGDDLPTSINNGIYVSKSGGGNNWLGYHDGHHTYNQYSSAASSITSAKMTVDCSRYTNTNQIPNLQGIGYWGSTIYTESCTTSISAAVNNGAYGTAATSSNLSEDSDTKRNKYFSARIDSPVQTSNYTLHI